MRKIYASMEIGYQSIKLIVAELIGKEIFVLAAKESLTDSVSQGRVTNSGQLTKDINKIKSEVEAMVGISLNKVVILVDANHAGYSLVNGYSTITHEEHKVMPDDITRAIQASVYNRISEKEELITVMPVEFMVDNEKTDNPMRHVGDKVSVKGIMVTVPKDSVYPIINALGLAGIEVSDISISGISDYFYLFRNEHSNKKGVIVNINNDTTTVSYFNRGIIVSSEVIYVGAENIINDLAYVYNLNYTEAKKIYERFALATTRIANVNEIITMINKEQTELTLNQYEVSEVVMARLVEIFKLAKLSIKNLTKKEISYIMFTGAASETPGFQSLLDETVGNGILVGISSAMGARQNRYVSVLGSIYYFIYKMSLKGRVTTMFKEVKNIDIKQPKSKMISKIFDVFKED